MRALPVKDTSVLWSSIKNNVFYQNPIDAVLVCDRAEDARGIANYEKLSEKRV